MKIEELKAMAPSAEIVEFNTEARYIITIKQEGGLTMEALHVLSRNFRDLGLHVIVLVVPPDCENPFKIYKLEEGN